MAASFPTSGDQAEGGNSDFQAFSPGDNASKVLSAAYQNKLSSSVARVNRMIFNEDSVHFGPFSLRKPRRTTSSTSSTGSLIVVTLSDVDCEAGTATGTVYAVPCDVDDPGEVDVVDVLGCYLEGPTELLNGVRAWVSPISDNEDPYNSCKYGIVAMCCSTYGCS